MKGHLTVGIIVVLIVLAGLSYLGFLDWYGKSSMTPVKLDNLTPNYCIGKMQSFSSEYGLYETGRSIFLNKNSFFIAWFQSLNWTVAIDGGDCRIVEEQGQATRRFQIADYLYRIKSIPVDMYKNTCFCLQNSVAKGASNVCHIVKPINQILKIVESIVKE